MRYADISDVSNRVSLDFATDLQPMTEIRVGDDGALYCARSVAGGFHRIHYNRRNKPVCVGARTPAWLMFVLLFKRYRDAFPALE